MDWQDLIVALAVLWAAGLLALRALRLWRLASGRACGSSCTGCKSSTSPPLVMLDVPPRDKAASPPRSE